MAVAVIPDEGMKRYLEVVNGALATLQLRLFQNNITPSKTSVLADFTIANFTGYASFSPLTWGAVTVAANIASKTASAVVFSFGLGITVNTIFGWYLVDSSAGKVLAANRLAVPKLMAVFGDTISVTLSEFMGDLP